MQDDYQNEPIDMGTLGNLTSYFVMQHAEKTYDWTPEKAGISTDQAIEAAAIFARFDGNDDYRLEMSEFKKLCDAAQFTLTDGEVMKAMELLDKRTTGYIEFDEFASWWVEKGMDPPDEGKGAAEEQTISVSTSRASAAVSEPQTDAKAKSDAEPASSSPSPSSSSMLSDSKVEPESATAKKPTDRPQA
jgi:hypothetical protein